MSLGTTLSYPLHIRIRPTLMVAATLLVVGVAAALLLLVRMLAGAAVTDLVEEQFHAVGEATAVRVQETIERPLAILEEYKRLGRLGYLPLDDHERLARLFAERLRQELLIGWISLGVTDGDRFVGVRRTQDGSVMGNWSAAAINGGQPRELVALPDGGWGPLADRGLKPYSVIQQGWFQRAMATDQTLVIGPYVFAEGISGFTMAAQANGPGGEVVGVLTVDFFLGGMEAFLDRLAPGDQLVLVGADGRVLSATGSDDLHPLAQQAARTISNGTTTDLPWQGDTYRVTTVPIDLGQAGTWTVVHLISHDRLYGPLNTVERIALLLTAIILVVGLAAAWFFARAMSAAIGEATRQSERIGALDLNEPVTTGTRIAELAALGSAHERMRLALRRHQKEVEAAETKLLKLVELGLEMSRERHQKRVLQLIVDGARRLTGADGATLYTRDGDVLHFAIAQNETLGMRMGIGGDEDCRLSDLPLKDEASGESNRHSVVACCVLDGKTIRIADIYSSQDYDFAGARAFDQSMGYRTQSLLTIPLKPLGSEVIGALQLINAIDPETGSVIGFSEEVVGFVEVLAAQAAITLSNEQLAQAHRHLLDSLTRLLAEAIDAKSPYTGGHCARVPEIALMLAKAAEEAREGPFREFYFKPEEWREFYLAAWLHDCGKITTPEHVIDKATKLETIYNRIHEIRTRFEVAKRDVVIRYLEAILAGTEDAQACAAERDRALAELDEAFHLVATCNVGTEELDPGIVERLQEIAKITWVRTLDDGLGLSRAEKTRRPADWPAPPVAETLLQDKPEHWVEHDNPDTIARMRQRFTVEVPALKFNLGEVHNLSVNRGTLTTEDRFHIQNHIIQTILMLERLPFPADLRRVPEWAGGHHERLDGKGYPLSLDEFRLSMPARILALADVFEALTASDRPYKAPKTLSDTLTIMARMVDERHIDRDLFRLFLCSGIWRSYGERYLQREQIDDVQLDDFLPALAA